MVSALWKACEDGDIHRVHELLKEASSVDIEVKDHTGATPLIQAVKGGHLEVVRALLASGADPFNDSSQGSPDAHTSDPIIRQVLEEARNRALSQSQGTPQPPYVPDPYGMVGPDPKFAYYPPPYFIPSPYAPYGYMPAPPNGQLGSMPYPFYGPVPPPPLPDHQSHQPDLSPQSPFSPPAVDPSPPAIMPSSQATETRNIPCRFYPSCKYGASCHYAHPQAPYQPGPLPPPVDYSQPSEGVTSPAVSNYYPPVPIPYPPPQPPISPNLAGPHSRPQSEVTSPINGAFLPNGHNGHPTPVYAPIMHPPHYPNGIPYGMPLPPPPPGYIQSPPMGYQATSPISAIPPFPGHGHGRNDSAAFSQGVISPLHALDPTQMPRSPPMDPGMELHSPVQFASRDTRRNPLPRRPTSMISKKPPCMFFPSGRCRNGNDCKYPHIMPEGGVEVVNGHRRGPSLGFGPVEERLGNFRIRDNSSPKANGVNGYHNGSANGHVNRELRYTNGKAAPVVNGVRRNGVPTQQRVPTEDDFPVLQGSHKGSPSSTATASFGFGGGLTAAQVLQAPPPKKDAVLQNGKASNSPAPTVNGDYVNGAHSTTPPEVTVSA